MNYIHHPICSTALIHYLVARRSDCKVIGERQQVVWVVPYLTSLVNHLNSAVTRCQTYTPGESA